MNMQPLLALLTLAAVATAAEPFDWNSETIHCGSLVYADNKTSVCFAEAFLTEAAQATGLRISPKFAKVALAKDEVFNTPLCVFTGEGDFTLKEPEQHNLRRYLENGGFVFACPSCSDQKWNAAFEREIARALPGYQLKEIPMSHEIFSTVHEIRKLEVRGRTTMLRGIIANGRLALVYSPEGLNDVSNAKGCCCCGGAEITDARKVNVNAVAYALIF